MSRFVILDAFPQKMNFLLSAARRQWIVVFVSLACAGPALPADGGPAGSLSSMLRLALAGDSEGRAAHALDWPLLETFYAARGYGPVWHGSAAARGHARVWLDVLRRAQEEGLDPQDYHLPAILRLREAPTARQRAWLELLLTDAFLRYAADVRTGRRNPQVVGPAWHVSASDPDPVAVLNNALSAEDFPAALQALPPPHRDYRALRAALARLRETADDGGWPVLVPGPTLRSGVHHAQVVRLRRRLQVSGDLVIGPRSDPEIYDAAVETAVERFQVRHGLEADGIVGPRTRAALNVSVERRLAQIRVNMERWRWMPRDLGERHVVVSLAGFELRFVEQARTLLRMRAITGRRDRTSPSFRSRVTHLVINPTWTVPLRIAVEDLLPQQRSDPEYFSRKQIRVLRHVEGKTVELDPADIDWSRYGRGNFPFVLRQDPGPQNSLGRLKFLLPNQFDIYLHDTPARELFAKPVRSFSSGCIRVQQPVQLAGKLLEMDPGWDERRVREAIASGETRTVPIPKPVPIYLVYLTAWVDPDGVPHFRDDVYGRDQLIRD